MLAVEGGNSVIVAKVRPHASCMFLKLCVTSIIE